ncbi:MAG: hypothetical protein WBD99_00280 [Thermodesulfobacteriota bacterium]
MDKMKVFRIADGEWEKIRTSLERCGDIGKFEYEGFNGIDLDEGMRGSRFVKNAIGMENKLQRYGYFSEEAAFVYSYLASIAAERLGLSGKLAQTFGRGYSWVRTGWFDMRDIKNQHVIKQMIFFNVFFGGDEDLNWDFNSVVVKIKLKIIFEEYVKWQHRPSSFIKDVNFYRNQLENILSSSCH